MVERLFGRSGGNPLFTEELIAAGVDGRGSLPPSLREALLLRVERLSEVSQRLLRALAVANRAREELLAEATGADRAAVDAAMREALEAQIVVALDSGRLGFRHALLREVLYDDLLPGERSQLHLAHAEALERVGAEGDPAWTATGIAHHYYAAGDQPKALRAALEASTAVRKLHAYGEAAGLLDRALELWPRVPDAEQVTGVDQGEVLIRAARAHYMFGEDAVGAALYEDAVEALGDDADPERLASVLTALATCQWTLGQAERSRATQSRGLALLDPDSDSPARARLLAQRLRFLLLQGRFREVDEAAPEALAAAEALDLDSTRAGILSRLGCALYALGREEEGRARMLESIEIAERTGFSDDLAMAYMNFADSLHLSGHIELARETAEQGIAKVADRTEVSTGGSTRSMNFIHLSLTEIYFDLGEWDRAEAELRATDKGSQGVGRAHANLRAAELALARGRTDEAADSLEYAEGLLREALEPPYIALLASLQTELELRRGDLAAARAAADRGIDRIQFCSEDVARIALCATAGHRGRGRGCGAGARPRRRQRRAGGHRPIPGADRDGPGRGRGGRGPGRAGDSRGRRGRARARRRRGRPGPLGRGGARMAAARAALPGGAGPLAPGAGAARARRSRGCDRVTVRERGRREAPRRPLAQRRDRGAGCSRQAQPARSRRATARYRPAGRAGDAVRAHPP